MGERRKRLSKRTLGIVASLALAIGLMPLPVAAFTAESALAADPPTYTVTVVGGTASPAEAAAGEKVTITADKPEDGKVFIQWTPVNGGLDDNGSPQTTFTMPGDNVTITAVFREILIDDIKPQQYTGKNIEPDPTVSVKGVDGQDPDIIVLSHTCTYENNVNAGTATVIVTFDDRQGSKSAKFNITEASITGATVDIPDQVYGDKPNPTVTWNGMTLTEDTDYTLSYTENAPVGTSTVTIAGTGNFCDSIDKEYNITARPATITVNDASKAFGEADPTFTGTVDGLVKDGDLGEIKYSRTNKEEAAGTYKDVLTATYTPNPNYTVSVVNGSFTIKQLYTVTWLDGDGSVLQTKTYAEGDKPPAYDGKTPTKAATAQCTYTFTGWDNGTVEGTTTTYKPVFDEKKKGVYEAVAGAGSTWEEGSSDPLVFTFKRSVDDETTFSHFAGILMDGKAVPEKDASGRVNWTAKSGSVIVELQPSYMATLSEGDHTLTALFDDGDGVDASFKVAAKAKPASEPSKTTPKTGDDNGALAIALSVVAAASLCAVALSVRRRRNER